MKVFKGLLFTLVPLTVIACKNNKKHWVRTDSAVVKKTVTEVVHKPETTASLDTLPYTIKTIREQDNNCDEKKDSGACSYAEIKYPVFKEDQKLNDTIVNALLGCYQLGDHVSYSLGQLAKDFIEDYHKDKKEGLEPIAAYTLDMGAEPLYQDSRILTLTVSEDIYAGGAHGMQTTGFVNWDKARGQIIKLNDLFVNGYEQALTKAVENVFRESEHLSPDAPLTDYLIPDGKFFLTQNFYLKKDGIGFFYNNYQIKPYSEGPTDLLVPYSAIKQLLQPNTVISQYIK